MTEHPSSGSDATDPTPEEWSDRYAHGSTPWDLGRPHPELVRRLPHLGSPGHVIVPGAGRGHDAGALADAGWSVTAIDVAAAVERDLRAAVGADGEVVIGDALGYEPAEPVEMIFDHTFFCAIPPTDRPAVGRWAARVLSPGGRFLSIVFPVGRPRSEGGPPHGMSVDDLADALGADFQREVDEPADHAGRLQWSTRWAAFRRRTS